MNVTGTPIATLASKHPAPTGAKRLLSATELVDDPGTPPFPNPIIRDNINRTMGYSTNPATEYETAPVARSRNAGWAAVQLKDSALFDIVLLASRGRLD